MPGVPANNALYCRITRAESWGVNCQFHLLRRMWSLKMLRPAPGFCDCSNVYVLWSGRRRSNRYVFSIFSGSNEEVCNEEVDCRACSRQSLSAEDLGWLVHPRSFQYGEVLRDRSAHLLRY